MTDISRLAPALPRDLDGFRIEIDAARERGDIILDRPPLNVIPMQQREQLRVVFEALDADPTLRVIVLRAAGEHFSNGGGIRGFLEASPSMSRGSPGTLQPRHAVQSRSSPPIAAIASGSVSSCRSLATSALRRRAAFMHCPSRVWHRSQARAERHDCRRWSASRAPKTS
jgi:Enoyl-CoA hydratase/isomerase